MDSILIKYWNVNKVNLWVVSVKGTLAVKNLYIKYLQHKIRKQQNQNPI